MSETLSTVAIDHAPSGTRLVPRGRARRPSMSKPEVGFVGLGRMGFPMARNLAAAGYRIHAHDVLPEATRRAAGVAGVTTHPSPREVAAAAGVVFTALPNDAIVRETYLGASGLLAGGRRGLVTCDCSTVSPGVTLEVHAAAQARGIHHLDTPMLGSSPQAESGEIFFMVGGDESQLALVRPMLDVMGRLTMYVGPSGTGNRIKLLHNALGAVNSVAVAESLALCDSGAAARPPLARRRRGLRAGRRARRAREPRRAPDPQDRRDARSGRLGPRGGRARVADPARRVRRRAAPPLGPGAHGGRRGMARPRPPARAHADVRARDPPGPDAREHPRRALPRDEALRGRAARPGGAPVDPAGLGAARRQDARHPGPGRDRPGGREEGRGARADGDRHAARGGARPSRGAGPSPRRDGRGAGRGRLRPPAPPRDPGDARFHERPPPPGDATDRVAPQLRARRARRRRGSRRRREAGRHRGRRPRRLPHGAPARRPPVLDDAGHHRAPPLRRAPSDPGRAGSRSCSSTTSAASSTASRSGTSSTGRAGTDGRRGRPRARRTASAA